MPYNKWHQHQIQGYRSEGSTRASLDTFRMHFAREKLGSPPKRIVDFGCCDGSFSSELASKGFEVIGVDLPEVLAGHQLDPTVKWLGINLDEPFEVEPFDVGLCLEILEHLLRDFDFLLNVRRLLKPGGYIIVSTPLNGEIRDGDHHIRSYPEYSLRKLLDSAGYEGIETGKGDGRLVAVAYT